MDYITEPPAYKPTPTPPRERVEWTQRWEGAPNGPALQPAMGAACKAVQVADHAPNSPEWLMLRYGKLGGSDAGTLIGHGFKSWDELLADKAVVQEAKPPTPAMDRGNWLEPAALAMAASKGYVANPELHGTWRNQDYPHWSLNPDGVTDDGVLIECKTAAMRHGWKWGRASTDQIPLGYLCQVTVLCGILGLERWVLPLIATKHRQQSDGAPGSDFDLCLYRGSFNRELFTVLMERAEAFMADLQEFRRLMA